MDPQTDRISVMASALEADLMRQYRAADDCDDATDFMERIDFCRAVEAMLAAVSKIRSPPSGARVAAPE